MPIAPAWARCSERSASNFCPDVAAQSVTTARYSHLLFTYTNASKLRHMNKIIGNTAAGRGPVDHEIRDQIVIAATEHFSQYGYGKTTVSDLARAIGFSKAYIYKFFESKQAIGEMICANCLGVIEAEVRAAVNEAVSPPEKLRRMFKSVVDASLRLFSQDRKLYEIATSAATERWQATLIYEEHLKAILQNILQDGRQSGDFERKTPLDETVMAIYLVMRPYINPLLLQHGFDHTEEGPGQLSSLVLRSLSP
ncbi:TetR family transcriptional regulator [Pseudomonas coronafaciens pv. garcae]|nr:TetR family transcriptional regulator [Pseudomonas coronafaciens pv. garcae]KPZ27419.1 hypothetical protein ALO38_200000 [Pseudomonas coronafaciens pv. zizaniae]RMS98732.1 TetR family transcriptional regulator [Pseudomonas coronafaciens pv. oryzae]RMS99752.1 TetR family transcriptional regulator [Pseudomonas coronafaciens pv. oryzae]RMV90325.1 TetR family transcriptional regulator [Pseudomonas coronafaciens pv. garcae]